MVLIYKWEKQKGTIFFFYFVHFCKTIISASVKLIMHTDLMFQYVQQYSFFHSRHKYKIIGTSNTGGSYFCCPWQNTVFFEKQSQNRHCSILRLVNPHSLKLKWYYWLSWKFSNRKRIFPCHNLQSFKNMWRQPVNRKSRTIAKLRLTQIL